MPVYFGISGNNPMYFAGLRREDYNGQEIFEPILTFDSLENFCLCLKEMQDFVTYKIPSHVSLSRVKYKDYRFSEISQEDKKRISEILSKYEED